MQASEQGRPCEICITRAHGLIQILVRIGVFALEANSASRYVLIVIKSFASARSRSCWGTALDLRPSHNFLVSLSAKLLSIDAATNEEELRRPLSNRLHKLGGDRGGQWSISIDMQYRVCFFFEDGDAHNVEIADYH